MSAPATERPQATPTPRVRWRGIAAWCALYAVHLTLVFQFMPLSELFT